MNRIRKESFSFARKRSHVNRNRQEEEEVVVDEAAIENTTAAAVTTTPTQRTRRFNLLSLLPLTTNPSTDVNGQRAPIPFRIDIEMSAWLAWYHYTNPSSNHHHVLPHIQERLSKCDIDFHFSMRDSKFSALNAANEFFDAYNSDSATSFVNDTNTYPEGSLLHDLQDILNESTNKQREDLTKPHAVIGSARSTVSSVVSYVTSAFMVPQISSSSTAAYLDNKDVYRTFARTIATNAGDAAAMALYLKYLNVTNVAVLYINDGYGNGFHSDLLKEIKSFNISVFSEPYDDLSIERSVKHLATLELRYIIALLNPSNWKSVIRLADQYQIIGRPDYHWIFGESSLQFVSATFQIDRDADAALARALHGTAVMAILEQPYEPFDDALSNCSQNELFRSQYISQHWEPEIFSNYSFPLPSRTVFQYFTYDAVTAMMLAACETPISDDEDYSNISGSRIYQQLLRTEFLGVSGSVAFHPSTGTRKSEGLNYGIHNILFPDELSTDSAYRVSATLTNVVVVAANASFVSSSPLRHVDSTTPFTFASNTTTPPLSLPPLEIDLNLIPSSVRAFCLSLSGFVMFVSLFWFSWTLIHRNKDVVKASQPIFLCQICIGAFTIASAVIPMSMQEPTSIHGLNIACMASPWLVSVGFVTTFSALFTKTWRLNRLFQKSRNLRRVVIRPKDVALPFILLMIINFGILLAWTLHAPLVWDRQYITNYDKHGRAFESVGGCIPSNARHNTIYLTLVAVINLSVLLFANYQAYIARILPSEFSESTYIALATGSLLEVFLLAIPLLFVSFTDPSMIFLIRSVLATVTSLSALLPTFLPKYFQRNVNKRYHDAVVAVTGSAPARSRVSVSTGFNPKSENSNTDEFDTGRLERGVSKIERNHDYFKEIEASFVKKPKRASFSVRGSSEQLGERLEQGRVARNYSLRVTSSQSDDSQPYNPQRNF